MKKELFQLSNSELEVMQVLWDAGEPKNTKEICSALAPEKEWKYTTVSTLLGRMQEKGAISHEKRGKFFYYSPTIERSEYQKSRTHDFLNRMFGGSAKNMVAALIDDEDITQEEIEEIRSLFKL